MRHSVFLIEIHNSDHSDTRICGGEITEGPRKRVLRISSIEGEPNGGFGTGERSLHNDDINKQGQWSHTY